MTRAQARPDGGEGGGYRGASPSPMQPPAWQRRIYVERPAELAALAGALTQSRVLAIDAEFVQSRARTPGEPTHRLALLQLAFDNQFHASYVVDALRLADLSPLEAALENGAILKLFHGISADARVLATRHLYPQHLLDLEAVSRSIFGQRESGLQAMLLRACGIRLDKSLQRADWGRRPLTPAMIAYAARDAEMTYVLYGWLAQNYPGAVALHELPAYPPSPQIADWISPALESKGTRSLEQRLYDAGLLRDIEAQARDLLRALRVVTHPSQRVRILRLIGELELVRLTPEVRPYLESTLADERATAARVLGRLRDWHSREALEALQQQDAVLDVRQAAETGLELLKKGAVRSGTRREHTPSRRADGSRAWVVEDTTAKRETPDASDWRAALLQHFGQPGDAKEPAHERDGAAGESGGDAGDNGAGPPDPDGNE